MSYDLDKAIRKVKDFPKKGILFYDVTGIILNPEAFRYTIDEAVLRYKDSGINKIVAVESRGFIFGAVISDRLGIPLVLARKKGKLPGKTVSKSYALEYGEAVLEIHRDDITKGDRVLVVDDLIATGGTLKASIEMILELGGVIVAVFGVIGLPFLDYKSVLSGYRVDTLIDYHGE